MAAGFLLPPCLNAGSITVKLDPFAHYRDGVVSIDITAANLGNTAAKSFCVEAELDGNWQASRTISFLKPEKPRKFHFDFAAPARPGVHTLFVRATYVDANNYPFSAIRVLPVVTAVPPDGQPPVDIAIDRAAPQTGMGVVLAVTSHAEARIDAVVRLLLPDGIAAQPDSVPVRLEPGKKASLPFPLTATSAMPGSTYSIAGAVDWISQEGQHCSVSETTSVRTPAASWKKHLPGRTAGITIAVVFLALFLAAQVRPALCRGPAGEGPWQLLFAGAVWMAIFTWLMYYIPPALLFTDTMAVGGDTPAHNYLASHLGKSLFHGGSIISWASGWWCGFPMFQYYFPLPYSLMALLSAVIPFNVALRLVSFAGVFTLPVAAWAMARWFRLQRPIPLLMAVASVPFLFVKTHTMWGANVYSTMSGMIANSLGFSLMLLFLGSCYRDIDDNRMRPGTVILGTLLTASHFFTTLIGGLAVAVMPFLLKPNRIRQAIAILCAEGLLVSLLMAWWLVPLVAKQGYAVDFGSNWEISLVGSMPQYALWLSPFAAWAVVEGIRKRSAFVFVLVHVLAISLALFYWGQPHVSPIFVNVRLWPFMFFSLLALETCGIGFMISGCRAVPLAVLALVALSLTAGMDRPRDASAWARWNYAGVQQGPWGEVFDKLVRPLDGTPGRLANDLHPDNHAFLGSTRIFESVPHLVNKPILEGGLVNSAAGSLYSYYVQGESSKSCAGYPSMVKPPSFNITNATIHCKLFNVKHFIACWNKTQEALDRSPAWKFVGACRRWQLYELTTHDGRYVTIPEFAPVPVRVSDWKSASLDWLYKIEAIDRPFVLLDADTPWPDSLTPPVPEKAFRAWLADTAGSAIDASLFSSNEPSGVTEETVTDDRILFRTTAIGRPHIIKCTWFPNWKVRGASMVYRVTPCFMLVYPQQETVEIYYGSTVADRIGWALSCVGWLAVCCIVFRTVRYARHPPEHP